jgi:hypothetical protein
MSARRARQLVATPATPTTRRLAHGAAILASYVVPGLGGPAAAQTFPPPDRPPELRAERATGSIVIDGRLDEPDWFRAPAAAGFRQIEPDQGAPATLDTEVRVLFDDMHLYVGALLHDPAGRRDVRIRGLNRDFAWFENDAFGITLDPFGDGRIGMAFQVNGAGVQRDQLIFDGTQYQLEWDGVWQARTAEVDGGWSVEMAIPWRTLRYHAGAGMWTVNFIRTRRGPGETSGWSPWPRAFGPYRLEYGGRLTGLEPPPPATNLAVQPYAITRRSELRGPAGTWNGATDVDLGGDLKWAITPQTVLDATFRTDFAEADVDRQVVNLSRFSVLFPERRPFFLENDGMFRVGDSRRLHPFFSRRIGLDAAGEPVRIHGGARLTSRFGGGSLGALLLRQGGSEAGAASTFGVARYSRNLPGDSRVGGFIGTRVDERTGEAAWNTTVAADALVRFSTGTGITALGSGTFAPGTSDGAVYVWAASRTNRGYLGWVQEYVGPGYDPGAGFVTRRDYIATSPAFSLDLRPAWRPRGIRNFDAGAAAWILHRASDRSFLQASVTLKTEAAFHHGGKLTFEAEPNRQSLYHAFRPIPGVSIAPGRYEYTRWTARWELAPSARHTATLEAATGAFYDGRLHRLRLSARTTPAPHVSALVDYTLDALRGIGPDRADLEAHVIAPELRLALNPRVQLSAFFQHVSTTGLSAWNARLSWEFRPLSRLHVVYHDRRLDPGPSAGAVAERRLIVKLGWLSQL